MEQRTGEYESLSREALAQLRKTKADKHECNKAMLLMEEIYACFREHGDAPVEICLRKRFGEIALILTMKGEEYNPVIEENIWEADEEDYHRRLILSANRERIGYSYKSGRNTIRIMVHSGSSKNVYYSVAAMALGILTAVILKAVCPETVAAAVNTNVFSVVKTIFLNALKMMVAPVVFFSIAGSIAGLADLSDAGKMGTRLLAVYMATTVIAIAVGLGLGWLLSAGSISIPSVRSDSSLIGQTFEVSVKDIIADIAPSDLVSPIAEGNMLQIIFVSVIFGIAANILGEQVKLIHDLIGQMNALCLKIVLLLVRFIPLAAFCSMASMILGAGIQSMLVVLRILAGVVLGGVVMMIVYMAFIAVFGKLSPFPFLKKVLGFDPTPFSLASSNATMPFAMNFCTEKLGISPKVSSFSIPLGATLNMDGHCIYLGLSVIILMKMYSVPITGAALTTIILSIFVLSIGAPGVTGSGVICLSTITVTLGLPVECIGIVLGIDQIVGMLRTVFNVNGDIAATAVVANGRNLLDKKIYYGKESK